MATGSPASIGGREAAAATIRFRLPDGLPLPALPEPVRHLESGVVEIRTEDEVSVLHALTGWALAGGVDLAGLTVSRETLEDVYLELTRGEPAGTAP